MLDRGHEDRDRGEDLLLIVSSAPERSSVPPVDRLNDVLRIRFCHLRTRRGNGRGGGPLWSPEHHNQVIFSFYLLHLNVHTENRSRRLFYWRELACEGTFLSEGWTLTSQRLFSVKPRENSRELKMF